MPTILDTFQRVLFNVGEAAHSIDFTSIATYMEARIMDGILRALGAGDGTTDPELGVPGLHLATDIGVLAAGQAFVDKGAGALELRANPGTLLYHAGTTIDGLAPTLLPLTIVAPTSLGSLAAADPTNPRYDLVEVKIEVVDDPVVARHFEDATTRAKTSTNMVKARRTQATYQVITGTAAATPAIPAITAGYRRWAIVKVPAAATAITNRNIWACTMPVRAECHSVHPYAMGVNGDPPGWARTTGSGPTPFYPGLACTDGVSFAYVMCPVGFQARRLMGVGITASVMPSAPLVSLGLLGHDASTPNIVSIENMIGIIPFPFAGPGVAKYYQSTAVPSYGGGLPIWTNGRGPHLRQMAGANPVPATEYGELGVSIQGPVFTIVYGMKWFTAG